MERGESREIEFFNAYDGAHRRKERKRRRYKRGVGMYEWLKLRGKTAPLSAGCVASFGVNHPSRFYLEKILGLSARARVRSVKVGCVSTARFSPTYTGASAAPSRRFSRARLAYGGGCRVVVTPFVWLSGFSLFPGIHACFLSRFIPCDGLRRCLAD
jgi:hypothetical protein